jgi:hypothetical protein
MGYLCVFGAIAVGAYVFYQGIQPDPPLPSPPEPLLPKIKPKLEVKSKPKSNEDVKAAINELKAMGFAATEAKKAVSNITASSTEEYVRKALERIEL